MSWILLDNTRPKENVQNILCCLHQVSDYEVIMATKTYSIIHALSQEKLTLNNIPRNPKAQSNLKS